jgi:hypothetical protein
MIAVVVIDGGLLETVTYFGDDELAALTFGRTQWRRGTDTDSMHEYREISVEAMLQDDHDYNEMWGGVVRGYIMHWEKDDLEVIVTQAEEWRPDAKEGSDAHSD